jgi:hypothetical protein
MGGGAVVIMARRGAAAREDSMGREEEQDIPDYLKRFPESASIVKDIQLGVLFGR